MSEQKQEIKVNFPEKLHGGVYANNMIVTHTKEEFVMDYLWWCLRRVLLRRG